MRKFVELFQEIDQTQSTNEKVLHIQNYFSSCSDEDGAWALFFLCGHRLKRLITGKKLLGWCTDIISIPPWLIEESYASVGDSAETISLLLEQKEESKHNPYSLSEWMEKFIKPLKNLDEESQKKQILAFWSNLSTKEIFILNKILTGSFRVGVSALLTLKGLSGAIGVSREILSQRLMGDWEPSANFYAELKSQNEHSRYLNPYPFYLAYPFEGDISMLGPPSEWIIEWKWDGIRGQGVIRNEMATLWSRGNELISDQFPELIQAFKTLPEGTVLDGEVLAYKDCHPLPFAELQKRLGRKNVSKAMIEKVPIVFMIYDILEYKGEDIRSKSMSERRSIIEQLPINSPNLILSEEIKCEDWNSIHAFRLESRERATEGIMLKKRDSVYGVGRQKGYWWKYKVDPMTLDAVLIYAQAGSGRRANLFTDYTFALWKDKELIPIAKAYSGLDQEEIKELDAWIRRNTEEKFGPVRKVKPFHVFEIAFEGIQLSKRHKSGIALRFPRILRWRKDKPCEECDTIEKTKETFFNDEV
ncbi:MAG: ATP-dependent DNA ligase [Parachlamydiaceae bacterium]|nr:ATP-dependent DNA ligase [Parachlamydiaceae bacterium]